MPTRGMRKRAGGDSLPGEVPVDLLAGVDEER